MNEYEIRIYIADLEFFVGYFNADTPTMAIEEAYNQGKLQLPREPVIVTATTNQGLTFQFTMCQAY